MVHQKHTKFTKPKGGGFSCNEIGILGAPCRDIKLLAFSLITILKKSWNIAYADADHQSEKDSPGSAITFGASEEYIDKISNVRINSTYHNRPMLDSSDLALVNANHFKTDSQIVFIHSKKNLESKLDKLSDVLMVILDNPDLELPGYLKEHLKDSNLPVFQKDQTNEISSFIDGWLTDRIPPLNGLVLIGGKSTRMKMDKSLLTYHGITQQEYMLSLLEGRCQNVYFSCRDDDQTMSVKHNYITDKFIGMGPYGGILSAFMFDPNTAWLVVAVDLPLLNEKTIDTLIENRNIHKVATCFHNEKSKFPEPLITIWEPRAYSTLLNFLSRGYSCPRKVLLNSDVEIIVNKDVEALTNVNTPEEHEIISKQFTG